MFNKTFGDKNKFTDMIKDISLSYDEERKKFEALEMELVKNFDFSQLFKKLQEIQKNNDQLVQNLNTENEGLRNQVKQLTAKVQANTLEFAGLNDKMTLLVTFSILF